MGTQEIAEKIRLEAAQEIQKINEFYSKRVKEIQDQQKLEYETFYDMELKKIRQEADEIKRGILLAAKLDQRKAILKTKRSHIEKVLKTLQSNFRILIGDEKYYQFLKDKITLLAESQDQILLSKEDLKDFGSRLQKEIGKKIVLCEGNLSYGLIIQKEKINYNYSIEAMIEENIEKLEEMIGKDLNVL